MSYYNNPKNTKYYPHYTDLKDRSKPIEVKRVHLSKLEKISKEKTEKFLKGEPDGETPEISFIYFMRYLCIRCSYFPGELGYQDIVNMIVSHPGYLIPPPQDYVLYRNLYSKALDYIFINAEDVAFFGILDQMFEKFRYNRWLESSNFDSL